MSQPAHRFPVLDLLRGIAALIVVWFHNPNLFGGQVFDHGYLAVDFFFMLSGFVLTLAYEGRLDAGWRTRRFMEVRLIRLYPLYLIALAASAAYTVRIARAPLSWHTFGSPLLLSTFMLPAISWSLPEPAYPFNFPCWSLAMELVANLFQAVCLRRRSLRFLTVTAAVAGIVLVSISWRRGSVGAGLTTPGLLLALPRTLFPYVLGMILFRIWQNGAFKRRLPSGILLLVLVVGLGLPRLAKFNVLYEVALILFVFPALLFAGANTVSSLWLTRAADFLGRGSYAMYVLAVPVSLWWPILRHRVGMEMLAKTVPLAGIVYLLVVLGVSVLLHDFYDVPVRGFLQRWRRQRLTGPGEGASSR